MNREEAIEKWVIPALKNTWNEKKCNEILKALEQEPCDAVSRKAAIDACLKGLNRKEMVSNIKALPPVQPKQRTGRWIANGETFRCSECGELACCQGRYCNECGAMMQEVEG